MNNMKIEVIRNITLIELREYQPDDYVRKYLRIWYARGGKSREVTINLGFGARSWRRRPDNTLSVYHDGGEVVLKVPGEIWAVAALCEEDVLKDDLSCWLDLEDYKLVRRDRL